MTAAFNEHRLQVRLNEVRSPILVHLQATAALIEKKRIRSLANFLKPTLTDVNFFAMHASHVARKVSVFVVFVNKILLYLGCFIRESILQLLKQMRCNLVCSTDITVR